MARHREEVNTQVASAKLEIERMRRRQGEIEREKQTLEETLEKQEQYERGKQEMIDRLSESIVTLHKMEEHASRQVEIYSSTRQRFGEFIEELQRINDAEWADEVLRDELNKAVVLIDAIRKEFVKGQAGVEAVGGPVKLFDESRAQHVPLTDESAPRGFGAWLKIGVAVSLPLVLAIAAAVIVILVMGR
jgi:chromosome segregation ATPase